MQVPVKCPSCGMTQRVEWGALSDAQCEECRAALDPEGKRALIDAMVQEGLAQEDERARLFVGLL